ncbi:MAG: DUF448 domain-containing protein [bacterium]|nr:DUF448 domain-containing protein [bacterium]
MIKNKPQRSCIFCKKKGKKKDFFRFVFEAGKLKWDINYSSPGRGAYAHQTWQCVSRFAEYERWERALKLPKGEIRLTQISEVIKEVKEIVLKDVSNTKNDLLKNTKRKIKIL